MNFNLRKCLGFLGLVMGLSLGISACSESVTTPRGDSQPFLLYTVKNPVANVILFPGNKGRLNRLQGNFLVRSRNLFQKQGFTVAIVDVPSYITRGMGTGHRTSPRHAEDISAVISYLRNLNGKPVWLIGTSAGSWSAASVASRLKGDDRLAGVVLTSSADEVALWVELSRITVNALVVHHKQDRCRHTPYRGAIEIKKELKNARVSELIAITGGTSRGDPCQAFSYHGYLGVEDEVVGKIGAWIKANNSR